jgi:hypothetical protein
MPSALEVTDKALVDRAAFGLDLVDREHLGLARRVLIGQHAEHARDDHGHTYDHRGVLELKARDEEVVSETPLRLGARAIRDALGFRTHRGPRTGVTSEPKQRATWSSMRLFIAPCI